MPNYTPNYTKKNIKTRYKAIDNYTLAKKTTGVKLPVGCHDTVWSINSYERNAWLRRLVINGLNVCQDKHPIQAAITSAIKGDTDTVIRLLQEYQNLVKLPQKQVEETTT